MADPIDVKAPDGSIVRFPAGTSDDLINSEMSKAYAQGKFGTASQSAAAADSRGAATDPAAGGARSANAGSTEPTWGDRFRHAGAAIDDSVRAVANGIPFMDRFAAGMGAATGIGGTFGDYAGNLARQRGEDQRLAKEAPVANTLAHVAGGTLGTAAAAPFMAGGTVMGGTGLLGKTLMSGAAGAGLGATQGVSDTPDFSNVTSDDIKNVAKSGAVGFGFGGLMPGSAKLVGKGVNAMADLLMNPEGISRGASKPLIEALQADGPTVVDQRMKALGLGAMLADGGFSLQGKAVGAALNSDEARSTVFSALKNRDAGTNQRIMSDVDRVLGPAEDPVTATREIMDRRSKLDSKAYPAALDDAPPIKTAPILTDLDDMIENSIGMEQKALKNLKGMMMKTEKKPLVDAEGYPQYDGLGNERFQDVPVSQDSASVLHKVKQELDNVIQYDAPGLGVPAGAVKNQQAALKQMRFQVNDALEQQVPGYADANRQSAALARRADAVEAGTQYLGSGKTTPSPGRFADEFAALEPGEQAAFAKGSRGNIDRVLGTKANDLVALKGELQGQGGYNAAKIATVHGQDAADELAASVDRNLAFRDTHNKVVENAQTAQRTAAKEAMAPKPPAEIPIINPNMKFGGATLTALKRYVVSPAYRALQPDQTRHYGEIANILTAQGDQRDAYRKALADALLRYDHNAQLGPAIGNRAAMAAALLGENYWHDHTAMPR